MAKTFWKYILASVSHCKPCIWAHGDAVEGCHEVAVPSHATEEGDLSCSLLGQD